MHYSERWNDEPAEPKIDWLRIGVFAALVTCGAVVWGFAIFGGLTAIGG